VCNRSPDERKILNVVVHTFYEPWQDTNGNGAFDPGEQFIDISSAATTFSADHPERWGPIWTEEQVNTQITFLKAGLAQARIRAVVTRAPTHTPAGSLFAQDPATLGRLGVAQSPSNFIYDPIAPQTLSRDLLLIHTNFRSDQDKNNTEDDDVVDVYLVPPFYRTGTRGWSITPSLTYLFRDPNISPYLPATFANQIYIGLDGASFSPGILLHEVMHLLTNEDDPASSYPAHIFFPSNTAYLNDGSIPDTYRRLQEGTVTRARTLRPTDNKVIGGNRLLRSP
jgi:hypothetical protein